MRLDDFDFDLPEDRIALRPAEPRDAARLLVVRPGEPVEDRIVRALPGLLRPGDVMVFNDTKVLPAAFTGYRAPRADHALQQDVPVLGPKVEINLHKRAGPNTWLAFSRPAKKLEEGDFITLNGRLAAKVFWKGEGGEIGLAFDREGPDLDHAIVEAGTMPLPPYIAARRKPDARDRDDYQTVYANAEGSIAAPTAGLHFTPELLAALDQRGIARVHVTLHVGAGTFLPVKVDDIAAHRMHAERGIVTSEAAARINAARAGGGRIVAVGTTSLRTLETVAAADGTICPWSGETDIFITPGYRFRACDLLLTNFHLPRSTLFMLVAAFAGLGTMRSAYAHAVAEGYRFYSYGDASLLHRA